MNNKNDVKIKNHKKRTKLSRIAVPRKERLDFSCNFFIAFVIIAILIIVVVNTTAIFCVCFPEVKEKMFSITLSDTAISTMSENDNIRKPKSNNEDDSENKKSTELTDTEKVESTLLSSGIAIISVAIAVWAGLNIIKALEKNKYKQLHEEIRKIENERKSLGYNTLLNSLSKLDDELNHYLYTVLKEIQFNYIDSEIFSNINVIELKFQELYKKHYDGVFIDAKDYDDIIMSVEDIYEQTENLSKYVRSKLQLYLRIRCAEIHFYLGYVGKVEKNKYEHMEKAVRLYCDSFPIMFEPQKLNISKPPFTINIVLHTYMLNTIGEAHRVIVKNCEGIVSDDVFKEYQKKALSYFNKMLESLKKYNDPKSNDDKRIQRELYYRCYGCTVELINGIDNNTINNILYAYQKSIDITLLKCPPVQDIYKPFQTYLSLIHKYHDKLIKTYKRTQNDEFKVLPDLKSLDIDEKLLDSFRNNVIKNETYIYIATTKLPNSLEFMKHKAFYYRDMAIFEYITGQNSAFKKYRKLMMEIKGQLEAIIEEKDYDTFMKEIVYQYNQLCEY